MYASFVLIKCYSTTPTLIPLLYFPFSILLHYYHYSITPTLLPLLYNPFSILLVLSN